jgi:geranylgeranyl reductase family protein
MDYDVIVVGGGPAGASAAYFNAKEGKRVLLIDKADFPRDKICGDGVTGKSLKVLHEMELSEEIGTVKKASCQAILMSSPNQTSITIPLSSPDDPLTAFCIEREILDDMLYQKAVLQVLDNNGTVLTEKVSSVLTEDGVVVGVKVKDAEYRAQLVIGADGFNGPVSRYVMEQNEQPKQNREHYSSAVREYWEDITENNGEIEIHFIEGILPGYFWIFPISETKFNVGIGMLLCDMDKQSVKLKQMLDWVINSSFLSPRFSEAQKIDDTRKGWMLPMGSRRGLELNPRKNFVEGCILVGDSASLIDPFTGEGIGNALVSGKLTAKYPIINAETGVQYQQELWGIIGQELTNSHRLQKLLKRKRLMNYFFKKASKKPALQEVLTDMLHNKDSQSAFKSKWFWFKALLF